MWADVQTHAGTCARGHVRARVCCFKRVFACVSLCACMHRAHRQLARCMCVSCVCCGACVDMCLPGRMHACARVGVFACVRACCLCVTLCVRLVVYICAHDPPLAHRRDLGGNRIEDMQYYPISGTLPASISALTALGDLCADRPHSRHAFCLCVCACACACVRVCVCACVCAWVSVCLCACVRACVYACVCCDACVDMCLPGRMHWCARVCVCLRVCLCMCVRAPHVWLCVRLVVCMACVRRLACIARIGSWRVAGTWAITPSSGRCPRRSPH